MTLAAAATPAPYRPDYAFDAPPGPGEVVEVAEGVNWVRMPLPFALDHINLWVLEDGDGWTHVDTGIDRDDTRELWQVLMTGALAARPSTRLICTHFHPDHFGLAGWFDRERGVPLTMTRGEWIQGALLRYDAEGQFNVTTAAFYGRHGLGDDWTQPMGARGNVYATRVRRPPDAIVRIVDGEVVPIGGRDWRVIVGTGHAPEHACLYNDDLNVLISGDQVLPRITTNVSAVASEPEGDPLRDFLDSLERFRSLPEDTLVLPSHGLPFRGLHGRLDDLIRHHDERLAEVVAACGDWRSAADIVPVLFRRELDRHQMTFAMGESIAHLMRLFHAGRLDREAQDDGIVRFRRRR